MLCGPGDFSSLKRMWDTSSTDEPLPLADHRSCCLESKLSWQRSFCSTVGAPSVTRERGSHRCVTVGLFLCPSFRPAPSKLIAGWSDGQHTRAARSPRRTSGGMCLSISILCLATVDRHTVQLSRSPVPMRTAFHYRSQWASKCTTAVRGWYRPDSAGNGTVTDYVRYFKPSLPRPRAVPSRRSSLPCEGGRIGSEPRWRVYSHLFGHISRDSFRHLFRRDVRPVPAMCSAVGFQLWCRLWEHQFRAHDPFSSTSSEPL
jgi:hypothetical protein